MRVFAQDEANMAALAARVAGRLRAGDVVLLFGDLGAGKTVFARGVIRALAGAPDLVVPSPTYTLVQSYDTQKGCVWHFDLYRLQRAEEIYDIGWDAAREAGGLMLIEWPERMGGLMPEEAIRLAFAVEVDGRRSVDGPEVLLS